MSAGYAGKLSKLDSDVIDGRAQAERQAIWGEIPGKVVSFDKDTQTITAQPLYRPSLNGTPTDMPELYEVPMRFARIGGFVITSPVKAGDHVTLRPQMRSSEKYHTEGTFEATDARSHSLADYEAFLDGGEPLTDAIANFNGDNFEIRSADGSFAMEMSEDGKFRFRGAQGDFIALLADAVELDAQGFTKLGTESTLDHTADYTAIGIQLTEIAGKLRGMTL